MGLPALQPAAHTDLLQVVYSFITEKRVWRGTPLALHKALAGHCGTASSVLPPSGPAFTNALNSMSGALSILGIVCSWGPPGKGGARELTVTATREPEPGALALVGVPGSDPNEVTLADVQREVCQGDPNPLLRAGSQLLYNLYRRALAEPRYVDKWFDSARAAAALAKEMRSTSTTTVDLSAFSRKLEEERPHIVVEPSESDHTISPVETEPESD